MDSWIYLVFSVLAGIAIFVMIIMAIIAAFLRTRKRRRGEITEGNWYLQIALSHEDALSQWFLVLGGLALVNALFAVNNLLDGPFSWRMILLAGTFIFLAIGYWQKSVCAGIIGTVGFLVWWYAQTLSWQADDYGSITGIAGLMWMAIILYVAGFWQSLDRAWKRFGVAYNLIGLLLINSLLFSFSTQAGLGAMEDRSMMDMVAGIWQREVLIFLIGAATVFLSLWSWSKKMISNKELLAGGILFFLFGLLMLLPAQTIREMGEMTAVGLVWAAIFNFVLFAEILGVIFTGYLRREVWMVNFGAILLIIFTAVKYFDWFFKFMDKSFFFIVAGILLFSVGWGMERGRKYLVASIKSQSAAGA